MTADMEDADDLANWEPMFMLPFDEDEGEYSPSEGGHSETPPEGDMKPTRGRL